MAETLWTRALATCRDAYAGDGRANLSFIENQHTRGSILRRLKENGFRMACIGRARYLILDAPAAGAPITPWS